LRDKIEHYLRSGYYFFKDISDFGGRKRLKKNITLYNLCAGKKAFFLGTGESLETIDINMLKNEYTLGANLIFLHNDIKKIDLNFYLNLDIYTSTLPQWPEGYLGPPGYEGKAQIYKEIDESLRNNTALILPSDNYKCINNIIENKTKYYVKVRKKLHVINGLPYKTVADLTKRRISGGSSLYFSIQVLMHMGFKEIYLCGTGYTYNPEYVFHFYDNIVFPKSIGKNEAIRSVKNAIEIRRKKGGSAEYYGLLEKGDLYRGICIRRKNENNPQHYDYHRKIKEYADSQGVKIINIVPEGFESPVYEKMSWEKVVSKILPNK